MKANQMVATIQAAHENANQTIVIFQAAHER